MCLVDVVAYDQLCNEVGGPFVQYGGHEICGVPLLLIMNEFVNHDRNHVIHMNPRVSREHLCPYDQAVRAVGSS